MDNFIYNVPTKIFFGQGQIDKAGDEILKYGNKILLVYGSGSIKKNGIYKLLMEIFKQKNISFFELPGVKPNPEIDLVREGIKICKENNIQFILAAGGGSVIDSCKGIAAGFYYENDPWDFYIYKSKVTQALPIGTILTISATGSEMNGNSVISNNESGLKMAIGSDFLRPKFSVLDPTYTYSVNAYQTASGTADIMSHCIEQYFSGVKDTYIQDRLAESILKTCIHFGPIAVKYPKNYIARSNLMWASSLALNGMLQYGKQGDWATHVIEHQLSAKYDLTHGIGLAIITPYWMLKILDKSTINKFVNYARKVWKVHGDDDFQIAKEGITRTALFFESLGIPKKLKDVKISLDKPTIEEMAEKATKYGPLGNIKLLSKEDVVSILNSIR